MSAQTQDKYMLLFRGNDWHKGLSPEEMQQVAGEWMAWFNRLTQQGKAIAGNPLEREGKIVSGKNGRVVADGPFAESKEAIGGYFLLQVKSFDEALGHRQRVSGSGLWLGGGSPARRRGMSHRGRSPGRSAARERDRVKPERFSNSAKQHSPGPRGDPYLSHRAALGRRPAIQSFPSTLLW